MPDAVLARFAPPANPAPLDAALTVEALTRHIEELRTLGIASLVIFGSVARGDAKIGSDVDAAVCFDPAMRKRGLAHLAQYPGHRSDDVPDIGLPGRRNRRARRKSPPAARHRAGPYHCLLTAPLSVARRSWTTHAPSPAILQEWISMRISPTERPWML